MCIFQDCFYLGESVLNICGYGYVPNSQRPKQHGSGRMSQDLAKGAMCSFVSSSASLF
jgi:hypothetical protein